MELTVSDNNRSSQEANIFGLLATDLTPRRVSRKGLAEDAFNLVRFDVSTQWH